MGNAIRIHAEQQHVSNGSEFRRSPSVCRAEKSGPLSRSVRSAKKKTVTVFAFRQNPGALAGIPLSSLQRLARVKLAGTYERKVLNAYVRFQSTFSEMQQSENGPASFQDLMRLLLRASELNRLDEPHSIQITGLFSIGPFQNVL